MIRSIRTDPSSRSPSRCRGCLETIEAELANEKLGAGDGRRLHRLAELIRELFAPTREGSPNLT
jgi:hypothetical protein